MTPRNHENTPNAVDTGLPITLEEKDAIKAAIDVGPTSKLPKRFAENMEKTAYHLPEQETSRLPSIDWVLAIILLPTIVVFALTNITDMLSSASFLQQIPRAIWIGLGINGLGLFLSSKILSKRQN